MKKWIVKQQDIKDCGVCSLLSIIKYYGGYIPLETLREDTYTSNSGTRAYNLVQTLKKYNFEAQGLKIENNQLKEINLPAIAHVLIDKKTPHFVVIYKITDKNITIMDPGRGIVKLSYQKWQEIFTGIIIICSPITKIISIDKPKNIFYIFKNILIKEKSLIIKIIVSSLILTIVSIISSFFLKVAISSVTKTNTYFNLRITIIIFAIITLLKIFITYIRTYFEIYLNKNIELHINIPFLKHLYEIPLNNLKSRSTGDIMERVNELENLKELFSKIFITIFLDLILALSSLIILINLNLSLTLVVIIMLIMYGITGIMFSPVIKIKAQENIDKETDYKSYLIENISGIMTIKNLNKTPYFFKNMFNKYLEYLKHTFYFNKQINNQILIKEMINEFGLFILMSFGIILISRNELNIINLIIFINLVSYLINPFKNTIDYLPKIEFIKASYQKINDFISLPKEELLDQEEFITGNIKINKLKYSYNGYNNIINNLSLEIKNKEKVLITGKSGYGKSTLCKLIVGLMKFDEGEILINNINLHDYSLNTIRENICYISQDEMLFSDTIYNNLTLNKKVNKQEFEQIMKICQVDKIVQNKNLRYETFLLEQGSNLSGGEKQRIILARALLRNCPILIMDESLSEIPTNQEKNILKELLKYYHDRIIIYVSHHEINDIFDRTINLENCYD